MIWMRLLRKGFIAEKIMNFVTNRREKMEPEILKTKPECRHWFQFVNRVDAGHMEQVCRNCKKVIFSWKDEYRDVRKEEVK